MTTPNRRHEVANYDNNEWGQVVYPPRYPNGERPLNPAVEALLDTVTPPQEATP